jgi:putative Holliday junction resolvase
MSVLGIDLGVKRIGLAISDPSGRVALPAGMIESRGRKADLAALLASPANAVKQIAVGLHMDRTRLDPRSGGSRPSRRRSRRNRASWSRRSMTPSSVAAERTLRETGQSRRKRKTGEADTLAATLLLRTFLERRANERGSRP